MARKTLSDSQAETLSYSLISITCQLKDYRLSYQLNRIAGLNLVKTDDFVPYPSVTGTASPYSLYYGKDEDHYLQYFLISNRGEESFLFPELRTTDFLLLTEGPFRKTVVDSLLMQIKSIPSVITAFEIQFSRLKNHQPVLSDLELHIMNINKERSNNYVRRTEKSP